MLPRPDHTRVQTGPCLSPCRLQLYIGIACCPPNPAHVPIIRLQATHLSPSWPACEFCTAQESSDDARLLLVALLQFQGTSMLIQNFAMRRACSAAQHTMQPCESAACSDMPCMPMQKTCNAPTGCWCTRHRLASGVLVWRAEGLTMPQHQCQQQHQYHQQCSIPFGPPMCDTHHCSSHHQHTFLKPHSAPRKSRMQPPQDNPQPRSHRPAWRSADQPVSPGARPAPVATGCLRPLSGVQRAQRVRC